MDSDKIRFEYSSAQYDDGGTGIDRDTITRMVFGGGPSTAAVELSAAASGATDLSKHADDEGVLRLTVSQIRLEEADSSCLNVYLETPDIATTMTADNSRHSRMVYRGEEYDHYQLGIIGRKN